jgi:hypothetical protein
MVSDTEGLQDRIAVEHRFLAPLHRRGGEPIGLQLPAPGKRLFAEAEQRGDLTGQKAGGEVVEGERAHVIVHAMSMQRMPRPGWSSNTSDTPITTRRKVLIPGRPLWGRET